MPYIFLDESGDLGFDFRKKKTSRYFIVTILLVERKRAIEKLVRRAHANLRRKFKMRTSVLHAAREEPVNIIRLCRGLVAKQARIMAIFLDKKKVFTNLRQEKHLLYNYIVNILLDRLVRRRLFPGREGVVLIASKRETNKFLNRNFRDYLCRQLKDKHRIHLSVEIKTPAEEKCLQAVDIASWSIFRKYEYGDPTYYDVLCPAIAEENALYK